jgi:hypothetical protein
MAIPNPNNLKFKDFRAQKKAELKKAREAASKKRQEAKDKREARKKETNDLTENVKNNTDQPKGLSKFTPILLAQGTHIAMTMAPKLEDMVKQMFNDALNEGLEETKDLCPPIDVSLQVLNTLNNIIDDLNKTSDFITKITGITEIIGRYASITQTVSTALKFSIPAVSGAAKAVPFIPGIIVSALDDLDWINNNLLYNNDGTPRLPKVIAGVGGITASASIVSFTINKVVTIIESITEKLEPCLSSIELPQGTSESIKIKSLSSETKALSELGNSDFEEQNPITYNGFIIEIETVPFTPTVNRYQAVGYNTYGIPMIKGELSFSPNALILTNELKFIIDRDNLKAY